MIRFDRAEAVALVRVEAERAKVITVSSLWQRRVERLSELCEQGISKTHIAFLGTAILAKALAPQVDLFAIKPNHASAEVRDRAYSARTLCHSVWVPLAAELGISLGVTGREPLNNQPYFRMTRLDDGTPVHSGGREAFNCMLELVRELQALTDSNDAREALRAFIAVRARYQPRYAATSDGAGMTPARLAVAIAAFVQQSSDGGKRAQAVVAGLLDVFAGFERVEAGRINDPSRKYPGDVCIRAASDPDLWEKAFEVRDKAVSVSDAQIFGKKCIDLGVREAALVMSSTDQPSLNDAKLEEWAKPLGLSLTLFYGWAQLVEQVLFWSEIPKAEAAVQAVMTIHERLVQVEASTDAVDMWAALSKAESIASQ